MAKLQKSVPEKDVQQKSYRKKKPAKKPAKKLVKKGILLTLQLIDRQCCMIIQQHEIKF